MIKKLLDFVHYLFGFDILPSDFSRTRQVMSLMTSLVVKAGRDVKDVRHAFVWRDDGSQPFYLFVMSKVSDPVGASGRRGRNEPLHCGVAPPIGTFQPMKSETRTDGSVTRQSLIVNMKPNVNQLWFKPSPN